MSIMEGLAKSAAERSKNHKVWGHGRTVFLSQKSDIEEALGGGYSMKEVWRYLAENGNMPIGYKAFTTYVYKFITSKKENSAPEPDLKSSRNSQSATISKPTQASRKNEPIIAGLEVNSSSMGNYNPVADKSLLKRASGRNHTPDDPSLHKA